MNTRNLIVEICEMDKECIDLVKEALDKGIDLDSLALYARYYMNDPDMCETYLHAFIDGVSLTDYNPDDYGGLQMKYIYLGLRDGLDVSIYNHPKLPSEAMKIAWQTLTRLKNN